MSEVVTSRSEDSPSQVNPWFVSLDIETLGLGMLAPIIEFGAVVANWLTGDIISEFHTYVWHASYDNCEPYAMSMHPTILRRIATREEPWNYTIIGGLDVEVMGWLRQVEKDHGIVLWKEEKGRPGKIVVAGKNVAGFDLPRLREQCREWDKYVPCHHRVIDPGNMFWNPMTDDIPPGSNDCLQRCHIDTETTHNALEDAKDVCQMVFTHVGRNVRPIQLMGDGSAVKVNVDLLKPPMNKGPQSFA